MPPAPSAEVGHEGVHSPRDVLEGGLKGGRGGFGSDRPSSLRPSSLRPSSLRPSSLSRCPSLSVLEPRSY